jgi:SAM-dependent methyltransferase
MMTAVTGHSAIWFGDPRDFWWNLDFLELVARRLGLDRVRSVLDVGCGVGHWGRTLEPVLSPEALVTGVDPEPEWVEEATRRAEAAGLGDRFSYARAAVESLPFEDASFDLVTCQTVLIHVADARAALREMLRVTKPGGLVLAAEPNNRASVLVDSSAGAGAPVEKRLDRARFVLLCERGKEALGEGNLSVGDLVPGYFAEAGAVAIQTFLSDKASMLIPPYEGEEQQALRADILGQEGTSGFGWTREEALRLYLAGGGTEPEFDATWERLTRETVRDAQAVREGRFHSGGGTLMYVIAARRPG